ncbi:MAG TPA: bifunctional precorrin-2 dehydrogenase/sirohydrochlorin ferrochelatase [Gemmatimonadaceae bacterium]
MSAYPIVLDGSSVRAVVVGGGEVAARKVFALLDAGADVHVVAPKISAQIEAASDHHSLCVTRAEYTATHLADATLVFAATDDATINAQIANDARQAGRLVNVVNAPGSGDFVTPAVHRSGDVVVAVVAGGVPKAAARIRDLIAQSIDQRYGAAIGALSVLRRELLKRGDRDTWRDASSDLLGPSFSEDVESGRIAERMDRWR